MDNLSIEKVTEDLKKEIKVDSEGKGWCSIRGAARLGDKDDSRLSKDLKSGAALENSKLAQFLISQGFEGESFSKWCNTGIPEDAVICILEYWNHVTQPRYQSELAGYVLSFIRQHGIQNLTNTELNKLKNKVNKKRNGNPEKDIQLAYHQEFGGLIEVETDHGRIDLLTDDSIYEFKTLSKYKEALGQLLMYGLTFPKHKKIAVLFNCGKKNITHIVCDFKKYNVEVVKLV